MSLTEDPRLPKAFKGLQGFLRLQGGPRDVPRAREQGGKGDKCPESD